MAVTILVGKIPPLPLQSSAVGKEKYIDFYYNYFSSTLFFLLLFLSHRCCFYHSRLETMIKFQEEKFYFIGMRKHSKIHTRMLLIHLLALVTQEKKKTSTWMLACCSPSRIAILLQLLSHTWMTTRRCIFCIKRTLRRINRHTTGVNDALWIFEPRRRIEKSCQGEAELETCNTPVSEQRVMMCLVSMAVHHILVHPQLMCSYYSASRAPWQTNKE